MAEREHISIRVNEHKEAVAMSLKPHLFSEEALRDIAEHQLRNAEKREITLYSRRQPVKHIAAEQLDQLRNIFIHGDNPHMVLDELARRMSEAKLVFIRTSF